MRYTFFEFANFKGIRHARLELAAASSAARVYALVGLNESGKTTILEAIESFQPSTDDDVSPKLLGGWRVPDLQSLIPVAERTNFNGEIKITCGVELNDDDVTAARDHLRLVANGYRLDHLDRAITISDYYTYENSQIVKRGSHWANLQGSGRKRTGRIERHLDYQSDEPKWQMLAKFLRSRLPTIWYFPNFLFDFPDKIYVEGRESEPESNRFYRALFQDVLDALDRSLTVERHVVSRYRSGKSADRENLDHVLLDAGRHVTRTVVSSWNSLFADRPMSEKRVVIDIGEDEPDEDAVEDSPPDDAPLVEGAPVGRTASAPTSSKPRLWVRFRLEDADGLFSVHQRSLGFRWFFVYLMLTTYRGRGMQMERDIVFLFDEPASNLHPKAQSALLASLRELSSEAMIIYTTHSHHLVEPTWLGTTYVVANVGLDAEAVSADFTAQRTDIRVTPYRRFAAAHPDQSHFFQPILDVLDYAPSQLEFVPEAVMVEGKSDFYLLAYYQQIVLKTPRDQRVRLMPNGGAGTLDDLIQLYIGWARPFVALLDSDKAGRQQAARYVAKFGKIVEPHLIQLDAACADPDVKGIESLLTEADKLAFQRLVDPDSAKYHKKTLALGVQEALVAKRRVALSEAAETSLERVLTAVRQRLQDIADDWG
jgi:hypothetical protein